MYVMVDIESDGPIPGDYSMISFGAVIVEQPELVRTFYGQLQPISDNWVPESLAVSGFTRSETLQFDDPQQVMLNFETWLNQELPNQKPIFIADNNGFDWMFICWYFYHFLQRNPFGHSSVNLNSLYKGLVKNVRKSPKKYRKTKHDHNPVNDAKGNAEALLVMINKYGLTGTGV